MLDRNSPTCRIAALIVGIFLAGAAQAQGAPPAANPAPVCGPSGYAPPDYSFVNRNVDGPAPIESVSPCNPKEVLAAADAVGMARVNGFFPSPLTVKNITTLSFKAKGSFADGTRLEPVESLDFQGHYGLPAARLMVQRAGRPSSIRVFNDKVSWTETTEGEGLKPARTSDRELLIMLKLTPFGAVWTALEAEGHLVVSNVGGRTVLTGASPYDGIEVATTLDEKNFPVAVTVKDGRNTYGATFADYHGTPDQMKIEWEPFYHVVFPGKITWTKNGRPWGDFEIVGFFSNPYVLFPPPKASN